ncbi:sodium-dependent transporter [Mollicutes bacterium LVI A0039]|nr:sodium-dependent transporter [Mollicutes bacterium LVI A0039]
MSENNTRQQFNSKLGFILAAVGSAVGLGNIWRFPYVLYENGGGSFLIPYFVAIFTAAIPLLILEYTLGNKFRGSAPLAFARNNPKFEWVGWIPTFIGGMIVLYYSSIVSWAINYLFLSLNLGWGDSPEVFFFDGFLNMSDGAFHLGSINLNILLGLAVIWGGTYIVCSRSIDKGIERLNKILLPILCVTVLFVLFRSVSLEGAKEGLNVLFTPDFAVLKEPRIWLAAYSQVFYSLSVSMGIMITYSSYLPKDSDLVNTAFITGLANSAFELTVSIAIFAVLGYMAGQNGVPVTEVVASGVGLAFIAFPQAFNLMGPLGSMLGVAFFATLVFAGFTSFVSITEAFITPFTDKFKFERAKAYKFVCLGGFLISSIYATGAGLYILDIVDYFINSFGIITVGILEAIVVTYVFGLKKFRDLANSNSIQKVGSLWMFSIAFIVPVLLSFNLVLFTISTIRDGYGGNTAASMAFYGGGTLVAIVVFSIIMSMLSWKNKEDLDFDVSEVN